MANASIAALRLTRNDVENLTSVFKCLLEYVQDDVVNNGIDVRQKQNCLTAIETLLRLGYKAVKTHGLYSKAYQKHFQTFLCSSCFEKRANIGSQEVENLPIKPSIKLAKSFVETFLLAINVFAKLGYPDYYQNFVFSVTMLFESEVVQKAGLSATAAKLVQVIFPAIKNEEVCCFAEKHNVKFSTV